MLVLKLMKYTDLNDLKTSDFKYIEFRMTKLFKSTSSIIQWFSVYSSVKRKI